MAFAPSTEPAKYYTWSGLALLAYLAYWLPLMWLPRGKPDKALLGSSGEPRAASRKLFAAIASFELGIVFLLPWWVAAASGEWAAAAQYFLPIAVMTAVNIGTELAMRRKGRHLAVYASTGVNNLWRLCAYYAALLDMTASIESARKGQFEDERKSLEAAMRPSVWLARAGVVISCVIILVFLPFLMALVPVREEGNKQA